MINLIIFLIFSFQVIAIAKEVISMMIGIVVEIIDHQLNSSFNL
jgi:hypothetical protein